MKTTTQSATAKTFTIIKTGYSAGIYGCSGEYFKLLYDGDDGKLKSLDFWGLYGTEQRVAQHLRDKGWVFEWANSHYGKVPARHFQKTHMDEKEILQAISTF